MSPTDLTDYNGPVALATDAAAGLFANSNTAAQLLDEQQLFCDPDYLHNTSPALSFFSTPDLGYLDTPDTVISHDFDSVFSPHLQRDSSKSSFEQYAPSKDPMFRDVTLFPSSTIDDSQAKHAFEFNDKLANETSIELFVDAASLSLTPANGPSIPASPSISSISASDAMDMPPPRSRPMNLGKLQRGRKRKSLTEDGEYSPSLLKRSFTDEDDIKLALRAKNTEAAARSRARKRAAMEDAEARIAELEAENRKLRSDLAELRVQFRA